MHNSCIECSKKEKSIDVPAQWITVVPKLGTCKPYAVLRWEKMSIIAKAILVISHFQKKPFTSYKG